MSKQQKSLMLALLVTILLGWWFYDHGMLPNLSPSPLFFIPIALPLYLDYMATPIWQLHSVRGSVIGFRTYFITCEFNTGAKVILKDPNSWTKGNGANIDNILSHSDDLLPSDVIQGIRKSEFEFWFRDNYPSETAVFFHKEGSDHYYLFVACAT
jgi:hypothetical protein